MENGPGTQLQYLIVCQQQHRPPWNRNKSFQGPQSNNSNPKPLQEKPPIPVSTATKNKLSNFQYQGIPKDGNRNKAVISLLSDDEKENEGAKRETAIEREQPSNAAPEQPKLPDPAPKDVPTTPAGRLALKDLIGMGDVQRAVQDISPDERIEWNHDKDMIPGSASAIGGIRRARKRARSSSPLGSPSAQASPDFSTKLESMNLQVDPGSELWGRYSLNGSNAPTPQGPSIPALANLMHTSSPQPTKDGATPRSAPSFRRANSCGNQFPKRRRVGGTEGDDVFTESAIIGPSKLAVLIERVQEGLTQPKQHSTSISSSNSFHTPLDRASPNVEKTRSIDDGHEEAEAVPEACPESTDAAKPKRDVTTSRASKSVIPNSSDYGEFDDDELDKSLMEIVVEEAAPIFKVASNPAPQMRTTESFKSGTLKAESEEFDDSDEDLFAADLENIASQYDKNAEGKSQIVSIATAVNPGQRKTLTRVKSESEDEFGDGGLDDLDFEAAEATATQFIQQTANSLLPVRTRFP